MVPTGNRGRVKATLNPKKGVVPIGSKDSASARARELPRMGAKTASRLGCGPDWEQRESEGARELLAYWVAVLIGN